MNFRSLHQPACARRVFPAAPGGLLFLALVGCSQPTQPVPSDLDRGLVALSVRDVETSGGTQQATTRVVYSIEVTPRRLAAPGSPSVRTLVSNGGKEPVVLPPGDCGWFSHYYIVDRRGELVFSELEQVGNCAAVDFAWLRLLPGETWFPTRGDGNIPPPVLAPGTYRFYVTDAFGNPTHSAPVVVKVAGK